MTPMPHLTLDPMAARTTDTAQGRAKLSGGHVPTTTIGEKAAFDLDRFAAEVRPAMFGRRLVA
jgi:hypothetical protein